MKDVKVVTNQGRTAQAIALFGEEMLRAGADGYTLQKTPTINANMTFTVIVSTLEKELTGEEATAKVIDEVPSMGASHEGIQSVDIDLSTTPITPDDNIAEVVAEAFLSAVAGVSAEAIVELNGYTKKAQMRSWCKRNNITLAEEPNQAAAMKKAILALVDPE